MNDPEQGLDVIAIGRSSVDLFGDQYGGRLEDMSTFSKYVGGCPTNIAVGSARLGLKAGLITRVGDDHMGRFIREQIIREGVCADGVKVDNDRLTALVILGIRDQETFPLLFYREKCADLALTPDDIDEAYIQKAAAVVIVGTNLSSAGLRAASLKAIDIARANGRRVVFDIDYRPVLWGLTRRDAGENRFVESAEVTAALQDIAGLCDVIVGTEEEFHILGGHHDTLTALKAVREKSNALLVCKLGAKGCVAFDAAIPSCLEDGVYVKGFSVEVCNVLGAGDGFMSGFLRGWLDGAALEDCCRFGNAAGAMVVARHGCSPAIPSWPELCYFLESEPRRPNLRRDGELDHLHRATNRHKHYNSLKILAIDHRSQFEDLCIETGADLDRVSTLKSLALCAVDIVAKSDPTFGFLADGRFGMRALEQAADTPYWIGRPIEQPGSCPLRFESSADVATEIAEWPLNHVVKCLVHYHPDDDAALRAAQEAQLLRLFDACRKTRHELLLEIICSQKGIMSSGTAAAVMNRLYDIGVRPDWWKLEPYTDADSWEAINQTIERRDPLCRGVVILGRAAPSNEISASFSAARGFPCVKGFAIGRTIFQDAARRWLVGEIDDATAVELMVERFQSFVDAWNAETPNCESRENRT